MASFKPTLKGNYYCVRDAGKILNLTRQRISKLILNKQLFAVKVSNIYLIHEDELNRFRKLKRVSGQHSHLNDVT